MGLDLEQKVTAEMVEAVMRELVGHECNERTLGDLMSLQKKLARPKEPWERAKMAFYLEHPTTVPADTEPTTECWKRAAKAAREGTVDKERLRKLSEYLEQSRGLSGGPATIALSHTRDKVEELLR